MRIGVTGPKGRLGSALVDLGCEPLGCDITMRDAVAAALADKEVVINAAAYTDVDGAEVDENQARAIAVNTRGPGLLRTSFDGYLIHVSTGYVFDGTAGPYDESAVPNPLNFYGMTKLGGEAAAAMRSPTLIVRTLDLFGPGPPSDFVHRCRDLLTLGQVVEAPTNQLVTPTYIPYLAEALMVLAQRVSRRVTGVLNVAGDATIGRFSWVRQIAEVMGYDPALVVATEKRWGLAMRPLRGGLLTEKARRARVPIHSAVEGLQSLKEVGGVIYP